MKQGDLLFLYTKKIILKYNDAAMDQLIFVLEMIGTAAFAFSGALVALKNRMDVFGVVVLGVITATGGGVLRDLVLGVVPPAAFQNPVYVMSAAVVSLLVFLYVYVHARKGSEFSSHLFTMMLLWMDSAGLAIFTGMGVTSAANLYGLDNGFLLVFAGVITGVGGGLLRDVIVRSLPDIFTKHIYAIASIVGALVMVLIMRAGFPSIALWTGCALILLIRLSAAHFRWSLPRVQE